MMSTTMRLTPGLSASASTSSAKAVWSCSFPTANKLSQLSTTIACRWLIVLANAEVQGGPQNEEHNEKRDAQKRDDNDKDESHVHGTGMH
jgi:hypothetical protein